MIRSLALATIAAISATLPVRDSHLCNRPPGKFLDWLELRGPKVRCPMPCSRLPPAVAAWRK